MADAAGGPAPLLAPPDAIAEAILRARRDVPGVLVLQILFGAGAEALDVRIVEEMSPQMRQLEADAVPDLQDWARRISGSFQSLKPALFRLQFNSPEFNRHRRSEARPAPIEAALRRLETALLAGAHRRFDDLPKASSLRVRIDVSTPAGHCAARALPTDPVAPASAGTELIPSDGPALRRFRTLVEPWARSLTYCDIEARFDLSSGHHVAAFRRRTADADRESRRLASLRP